MKVRLGILAASQKLDQPIQKWDYTYLLEMPVVPRVGDKIDVWPTEANGKYKLDKDDPLGSKLQIFNVERVSWQIKRHDDGKAYTSGQETIGKLNKEDAEVILWVSEVQR